MLKKGKHNTQPKRRAEVSANVAAAQFGSCTDIGLVRDHNEDNLLVRPPLYIVADGMGGHAAGEVASEIAVQTIANQTPRTLDADALGAAVESANRDILKAAQAGAGRAGMGTTITAAMLEGERLVLAQVGDSRAYLLHNGVLQQLTRDHSLVADLVESGQITPEEARNHPNRNIITRALGAAPYTRPDLYELNVTEGDRILLCSDGLHGMVSDFDIATILNTCTDPQVCANQLIEQANAAGGADNITAIVIDVTGFAGARLSTLTKKTKRTMAIIAGAVVLAVVAAIGGLSLYMHNSAYITDEDGYVAIYKGLPDGFLGLSYQELFSVTNVETSKLSVITGSLPTNVKKGVVVDSVAAAQSRIKEWSQKIYGTDNGPAKTDNAAAIDGAETTGAATTTNATGTTLVAGETQ